MQRTAQLVRRCPSRGTRYTVRRQTAEAEHVRREPDRTSGAVRVARRTGFGLNRNRRSINLARSFTVVDQYVTAVRLIAHTGCGRFVSQIFISGTGLT